MPSLQIVNIQQVGLESPYEKNTTVWASVRQSGSSSQGKKYQTWDLVWVTGGPLETIFVKTFFQKILP